MIPSWLPIAGMLATHLAVGIYCYQEGKAVYLSELESVKAVAIATDTQYRRLEKEVADAQAAHVKVWSAARDASNAEWVRLKANSQSRVSQVCPQSGGVEGNQRDGVEAASAAGNRDLLPALVDALATGEDLEARLRLCQVELRQCAQLR